MSESDSKCPHCGVEMLKWEVPLDLPFDEAWHYVCFNDECPYFVKGWKWMEEHFGRNASYRHRKNPNSNESGPLAVWSNEACRNLIIDT